MDRREFLRVAPAAAWGLTMPDLLSVMHQRLKVLEREVASLRRGRRATDWSVEMGDPLFNEADGLLLLGPYCEISPTEWWSLREQMATLSGSFRQGFGRWMATRSLQVNLAVTNLIENPSFEVNITDFWLASNWDTAERSATHARFGGSSCRLYDATIDGNEVIKTDAHEPVIADTAYTLSVWIKKTSCTGTGSIDISWFTAAPAYISSETLTLDAGVHDWKRYVLSGTSPATATQARLRPCFFTGITIGTEFEAYVDGVQFEKSAYATPYLDGTLGTGFAWTGVVHNSTSTRAVTQVNLDALTGLISGNNTLSFRAVVQMPYDADATWPVGRYLLDARGADSDSRILLRYLTTDDEFSVYINGDWRITNGSVQTFKAGDWVDLVLTLDFTNDEYYLYVNGVRDGYDVTTALAAPTLTEWNIGSDYLGASQTGLAFAEFATFDCVLTPTEVAGLFALGQPLVDMRPSAIPAVVLTEGGLVTTSERDADTYSKYYNRDVVDAYPDHEAFINLQRTDPNSDLNGVLNVGIRHDTNNQASIGFWLNEIDLVIQDGGNWRSVLQATYDKIVTEAPLRIATGGADPVAGIEDGMLFYRTDTDKLRLRANGAWVNLN